MSLLRRTLVTAPAALGLISLSALPAAALPYARTLFSWNGTVDREVVLVIRGRNVETRASGLDAQYAPRLDVREALPRTTGDLGVQLAQGRGQVEILQTPSARNDYTALVRVTDPRAGQDNYRLIVSFDPTGNVNDPWGNNNNDGRDRNGGWDNNNNRNGNGGWDNNRNGNNGNGNGNANGNRGRGNDDYDVYGNNGRGNGRNNGRLGNMVTWSGDVDDVVDIRIQGNRAEYRTRSGQPLRNVQFNAGGNGIPRRNLTIEPDIIRGRGDVTVIQQPTQRNGYTTIIRIQDRSGGYGRYDFDLRWY